MSFGKESTRTDRPNFPPQRFLTKAILTARKSRQRRTKWWVGLKMDLKNFWPDFSSVNTLPPKSQCGVLDLSVLDISINIWLNGTFEVPILCASIGCRNLCRMVTQIRHLGVSGARWSSGRHGWIVFCVHLSYFNLEYLSHLIFILIPLWRGFYFSEDMLSDVHTIDVSYHRTRPWCPATCGAIADCLRILVALLLPCY